MASPRPALVISRRAGRTTPVDTRGWMGGVSRRAILSIKPETFFRAAFETSLKVPRSLSRKCVKGYTPVEGCQDTKAGLSEASWLIVLRIYVRAVVAFARCRRRLDRKGHNSL